MYRLYENNRNIYASNNVENVIQEYMIIINNYVYFSSRLNKIDISKMQTVMNDYLYINIVETRQDNNRYDFIVDKMTYDFRNKNIVYLCSQEKYYLGNKYKLMLDELDKNINNNCIPTQNILDMSKVVSSVKQTNKPKINLISNNSHIKEGTKIITNNIQENIKSEKAKEPEKLKTSDELNKEQEEKNRLEKIEEKTRIFKNDLDYYMRVGRKTENVPELFRQKYPIFKVMDENNDLESNYAFNLYTELFYDLYVEVEPRLQELYKIFTLKGYEYLSDEKKDIYINFIENYENKVESLDTILLKLDKLENKENNRQVKNCETKNESSMFFNEVTKQIKKNLQ
jgi:hypothetical protein